MKNIKLKLFVVVLVFSLYSCGGNESNSESLVKKRIIQKIESDGMGVIKDLKIESVEKLNDTIFKGVHSFTNPMFDKEVRITRNYTFTTDLDSITNKIDIKTEMKSEGEWVKTVF